MCPLPEEIETIDTRVRKALSPRANVLLNARQQAQRLHALIERKLEHETFLIVPTPAERIPTGRSNRNAFTKYGEVDRMASLVDMDFRNLPRKLLIEELGEFSAIFTRDRTSKQREVRMGAAAATLSVLRLHMHSYPELGQEWIATSSDRVLQILSARLQRICHEESRDLNRPELPTDQLQIAIQKEASRGPSGELFRTAIERLGLTPEKYADVALMSAEPGESITPVSL